ncbi:cytochrome c oxidase subunit 4 [Archangium gephyra]|uniref:Cytochrome c oxidase polypeptide IV n=1 Tax=Archangium gephyra TaxID=48 RepID=A0AAC8Q0K5_9BACT|nr:cytochrome C oxidase subunit IV family protein [Archangium gephyra]AKI98757.1 Cytochrome c oxidase polypeptide IV [Archangium gephyra]REG30677.1 cytochrome c oxidase subunit 4 [Archangium gephyra]
MAKTRSTWGYVGVWVVLVVLTLVTWVLGTKLKLGPYSLPASMGIAVVKTVLVAMFFMHLVEQRGTRRVVLPVSVLFLGLLLGVTLLEAMTRVRMARPDGIDEELEPKRPASTRTVTPGSGAEEPRWMGN